MVACLFPTGTSIYWLFSDTDELHFPLFSISGLLLDLKFFLFLHAFERIGYYIVIAVIVGKRITIIFLGLFFILVCYAHAFFVLLKPRQTYSLDEPPPVDNNDPNNPWKLTDKFVQILEDGTIQSNPSFVQVPDANTNLFIDFRTSVLSTYLYLLGVVLFPFLNRLIMIGYD